MNESPLGAALAAHLVRGEALDLAALPEDPALAAGELRALARAATRASFRATAGWPLPLAEGDLAGPAGLRLAGGILLHRYGAHDAARAWYRKALDEATGRTRTLARLGTCLSHLVEGEPESGLPLACGATGDADDPELRGAALGVQALVYRDIKDAELALEHSGRAVATCPGGAWVHLVHGKIGQQFRRLELAEAALRRGRELGAGPRAEFHLALVLAKQGNRKGFLAHMSEALTGLTRSESRFDQLNAGLGSILFGNVDEGFRLLQEHAYLMDAGPLFEAKRNGKFAVSCPLFESHAEPLRAFHRLCDQRALERQRVCRRLRSPLDVSAGRGAPAERVLASALFLDVRGFTRWSCALEQEGADPGRVTSFLQDFYQMVSHQLKGLISCVKFEGDGVMVVAEGDAQASRHLLTEQLLAVRELTREFQAHPVARNEELELGGGFVHGRMVRFLTGPGAVDYVGYRVNLAARLCDRARPRGLLVCADPELDREAEPRIAAAFREVFGEGGADTIGEMKGIPRSEVRVLRWDGVAP